MKKTIPYEEECIHDTKNKSRGESSVFYTKHSDGSESCRKEYKPNIDNKKLALYHKLHNALSKYNIEINTNFKIKNQHISKIKFQVLPLGNKIAEACSLEDKKTVCISHVPYVKGDTFMDLAIEDEEIFHELYHARDIFRSEIYKKFGKFSSMAELNTQLGDINMKCQIHENTMDIIVTDMCAKVDRLYKLCDETRLELLENL